ncbi:MAG: methylmalonyl-CoA mutase family protein [Planctomycetes bacterium]|nr:methylmalonyl-CoA mutase family protein [Planctomycetota bacterium]
MSTRLTTSPAATRPQDFRTTHKIRLVTATSLFDGHDASINIMRRVAQALGAEVIHLGHNRSAGEVVDAAIQEDAQGIALTSYQGGHNEYFRYMHDLLRERDCGHIRIFGGGGGVILPAEIEELQQYGICRLYSPDDGRAMGLEGMVQDMLQRCDFAVGGEVDLGRLTGGDPREIAKAISIAESDPTRIDTLLANARGSAPVVGVTGTGGAGKSSLIDELVRRFLADFADKRLAILSVDPSRRKTGGALLGDRIRMNAIHDPRVYMRSLATRAANVALAGCVREALAVLRAAGFDLVILESSGIGQSDTEITEHADVSVYVMTPEYGAATQLEKIDMLDYADLVALNKFDRRGALDALRDVKKQFQRNRKAFDMPFEAMPVHGTMASHFNDPGTNALYKALISAVRSKTGVDLVSTLDIPESLPEKRHIIPPQRIRYLAEIADSNRGYDRWAGRQVDIAQRLEQLHGARDQLARNGADHAALDALDAASAELDATLDPNCRKALAGWDELVSSYRTPRHTFSVRGKQIEVDQTTKSLSGLQIPKVALPRFHSDADRLRWLLTENVPGAFPFAAGVFPFKRTAEDPTRMFAGEGGPERTNRRFHYVAAEQPAKRLSTAFDSVTLYGHDPDHRPDIYGKIGNAGVAICTVDDAKKLYSGFDLCAANTSVSMTINGPAPMLLAFFMNAAIDQQCERYIAEHGLEQQVRAKIAALYAAHGQPAPAYSGELPPGHDGLGLLLLGVSGDQVLPAEVYAKLRAEALSAVRGTVQADILKEDQAQNTCIFSTEFALRMMGDIQEYFTEHQVRNFYSVSISGYHIAEAGANPITQLALTLSNGFTYVEYYLARGLHIDDFTPNLSFFFSNGVDPEYAVIGRVARRIWAKAIKHKYGGNERSQKLKYHIQTSGRSLHAQEISFNDIRTTLQALYAIYDNCQSLHTNAYDEAITTPTEESVRRAMAIQLIINRELGLAKNENPLQGAFIIEELTDLVEEAVYLEFERLSERGGVLGAMETMYQRGKIQEESMYYETLKASGELPLIGVNTFLGKDGSPTSEPKDVMRSTEEEKQVQIASLECFWKAHADRCGTALEELRRAALGGGNTFAALMEAAKYCSLGQISQLLYEVGGQYRRSM